MNARIALAGGLVAAMTLLSGCTSDDRPDGADGPIDTSTASPTRPGPTPSVDSSSKGAIALRGDWEDRDAEYVVHFEEDGTFTEEYQGLPDFRTGKYEVEGSTVRLLGDDGNTDEGKIQGSPGDERLVFKIGTLTRQ